MANYVNPDDIELEPNPRPIDDNSENNIGTELTAEPKDGSTGEENADITNVPIEKEDKRTADEDESPKQIGADVGEYLHQDIDNLGNSSIPEA